MRRRSDAYFGSASSHSAILAALWTTLPCCPWLFGAPDGARPLQRWPLLLRPDAAPLAGSQALGGRRT